MRRISALLLLTALAAAWSPPGRRDVAGAQAAERPNILVVVTDDQRAIQTITPSVMPKTLSWLVHRGVRFPNAFATTPVCCPARASIFTGRYAHNHGVLAGTRDESHALDQRTTVQRYLQRAGYRTALFGKYLNGWDLLEDPPHFDEWAMFARGAPNGYYDHLYNVNGTIRFVAGYGTTYLRSRADRFIRRQAEEGAPWFLYVAPFAPHSPAIPEPRHERADVGRLVGNPAIRETDRSDKPPAVRNASASLARMHTLRRGQLRALRSVDDLVGRLMRTLRETGEERDTLVIFLSDNGMLWGEHGISGKAAPYTLSVRVPLLLRWPAVTAPGVTDARLVANIDVAPTIFDAAGIRPSHTMDGRSLLDSAWERPRLLLERYYRDGVEAWASTRTPEWQYTEHYGEGDAVVFREFYDHAVDPWQLENRLAVDDPASPYDDPANDPPFAVLARQLATDRGCEGRTCP